MSVLRYTVVGTLGAAAVGGLVWGLIPEPVPVDLSVMHAGPMQVTVSAEGKTRVREPWLVTAPIAGTAVRSPVEVGDRVIGDETVVAVIQPLEPAFLDARARAQAEAAITEARAAVRLAEVNLAHAQDDLTYASGQLERNRALAARGTIPQRMLEDAEQIHSTRIAARDAARTELDLRRAILARAEAQLLGPASSGPNEKPDECCIEIRAPQDGTVLEVHGTSARPVQLGMPLVTIGDLGDLEIEVMVLSGDAVRIAVGAPAWIERWGGAEPIFARVRRIDPAAITRVSALGIEEQRVRVLLDLSHDAATAAEASRLGDGFAVHVRIVVWAAENVPQVPIGALFRSAGDWATFRNVDGRAVLTPVSIGQRTDEAAQITAGLDIGDRVIAYPSHRVTNGARIVPRAGVE